MSPSNNKTSYKIFYYALAVIIIVIACAVFVLRPGEPESSSVSKKRPHLDRFVNKQDINQITSKERKTEILEGAQREPSQSSFQMEEESIKRRPDDAKADIPPYLLRNKRSLTPREDFMHPRWSPDGLDILVTRSKYRGLFLVSASGGEIRQLSDEMGDGFDVTWSLDGSKIIINKTGKKKSLDITGEELTEDIDSPEEMIYSDGNDILVRDPETGEELKLTDGGDAFYDPSLSPGGDKVAYEGLSTGIKIKDMETGEITDVGQGSNAQWTPDGEGIVYQYTQDDGHNIISGDIYYADAKTGEIYNITDTPDIIEMNPRISPDGRYIIYEVDGQIFIADLVEGVF